MPKVKYGRRRNHYRAKNAELKKTPLANISNITSPQEAQDADFGFFDCLTGAPGNWHFFKSKQSVEFTSLQESPLQPTIVKYNLTLFKDLHWEVRLYGKLIPTQSFENKLPLTITSNDELNHVCEFLTSVNVCSGNNDDSFVKLLEEKGGVVMNKDKSVVAYVDKNLQSSTVRHANCRLVCIENHCCSCCADYRATLRAMHSRASRSKVATLPSTDSSSHTNYRYLNREELEIRLANVQSDKRALERGMKRLEEKLSARISEEGIELHDDDIDELSEIFEEADKEAGKLTREHFQRVFWEQQVAYNKLKNKRRMRWHPLMIRFALNLKYLSSSAYKAMGNFIALPSQRTLCDYTHIMQVHSGVSYAMISHMKDDMNFPSSSVTQKMVGVLVDEMKIKSGLVFNKSSGRLVGFVDLGQNLIYVLCYACIH